MTSAAAFKQTLLESYKARARGDLDGTMAAFAEDAVFEFNGRGTEIPRFAGPVKGKSDLRPIMQDLIENYRLSNWRDVSLLVDGDKALVHWRATVTITSNGKAAEFDVFDLVTFRDGEITYFHQSTDTAMIMAMSAS